ncbi:MarR family transcriptional regulator [Tessaracoccus aquimaris]|uniref:MarR family transcriptional regulator n=1 Tax=Tessaracoccus aquimaris TaxID=1332264 RepID=A0A1Q2CJH8_9ACTN|nr:MarR family transcriptional regulator [Tessaracoccus aquimaris]AQP46262.1 MarR family transcriptional regulator [Tessaracoccus aquimaris]
MVTDHVSQIREQWAQERPDLDTEPIAIVGRLHRIGDHLRERIAVVQAEFGLNEGEFDVLATLRRAGQPFELSPNELAAWTMVTSGAITKRVDRLAAAGYVERERAAHDRRGRVVRLTAEGRDLIDRAVEAHLANERALLAPLRASERVHLAALLRAWSEAIENGAG